MIEKVRVSLWDIFTFFLTGFFAASLVPIFTVVYSPVGWEELAKFIGGLPPSIIIVASPLAFTLTGMLIEPFANYLDKYLLKY